MYYGSEMDSPNHGLSFMSTSPPKLNVVGGEILLSSEYDDSDVYDSSDGEATKEITRRRPEPGSYREGKKKI